MLLFAHMGFALAAARFTPRANLFFVALGAMLPDIIDKPLGQIVFGTPAMGRTFFHTLLFLILLATAAYYLRSICLASLAGGVLIHLALDFMWASPQTLFWPFLGGFPLGSYMDALTYIETLLMELKHPGVLMTELLGLGCIIFLVRKSWKNIVITGREFIVKGQKSVQMMVQIFIKWS